MDSFLFPIARKVAAKSIASQLVSIRPLSSPMGIVFDRKNKLERIFKSSEWRQHKIEELLK